MPRASVLIPTYNRVAYVAGAIETVLDQTYREYRGAGGERRVDRLDARSAGAIR
jgi:glycosyltransferase involved in cell wall biosynthesis